MSTKRNDGVSRGAGRREADRNCSRKQSVDAAEAGTRLFRRTGVAGVARAGWGGAILKFERVRANGRGAFSGKIARITPRFLDRPFAHEALELRHRRSRRRPPAPVTCRAARFVCLTSTALQGHDHDRYPVLSRMASPSRSMLRRRSRTASATCGGARDHHRKKAVSL